MNLNPLKRIILSAVVMMMATSSVFSRPHCAIGVLGFNLGCVGTRDKKRT